jgi:hypothetical protein
MPFSSIKLNPGVNTVATPTLNSAGISKSNLIRYRMGLVEKLGGWTKFVDGMMDSITRALHVWIGLDGHEFLAAGNLNSLTFSGHNSVYNITPQSLITNPAANITTVQGTTGINIVDTAVSNLTQFDAVFFNTPITIGGVILSGFYQIGSGSGTGYTMNSGQIATSSVSNAGAVPALTTTAGDSNVLVTFANHGLTLSSKFNFPIPTIVGGITIFGVVSPIIINNANSFTFSSQFKAVTAQTASMNSGLAQYLYYVSQGPSVSSQSGAWGPIGQYAIGEGYSYQSAISVQTGAAITASNWTLDNWGEYLLACPRGGPIFYWNPHSGFGNVTPIGGASEKNNGIFVSMPQQILVAWGSASTLIAGNTNNALDALLVRWSTILDFTNWQVNSTTQAGSFHIPSGSEIRGGIQGPGSALIFTDIDVWAMNYIGYPLVFGFNKIYSGGGLVGPHAVVTMRNSVFWMSGDNFYMSGGSGGTSIIPCTVWDTVFQDLDTNNISKCVAGANDDFSEITFFYPSVSGGTGENDKYAKVNISEGYIWDTGSMERSAWFGRSVIGSPVGADPSSLYLYQHETSYSADGAPMDTYFETGYFVYGDGENFSVIDHFEPDMKFTTVNSSTPPANISVTLTALNYPNNSGSMTSGPLTMTSTTEYLTPRLRGRQMKWRVETNDATSWWRMGSCRYRYGIDGRR